MSVKYRKHYMSRNTYRTRSESQMPGQTVISGKVEARKALERILRRSLHPNTRVVKRKGNWVFMEPRIRQIDSKRVVNDVTISSGETTAVVEREEVAGD